MIYTDKYFYFNWDPNKAQRNIEKHGISFEQAVLVFYDPFGRIELDVKHTTRHERRELRIGESDIGVLVVVFTVRYPGPVYRLISARRASRRERRLYEQNQRIQF